ncbi:MAG: cytochrome c oxidase subunit II [Anaerolineales bacterium]|jgi:cytochrome c oxidase subunit 2
MKLGFKTVAPVLLGLLVSGCSSPQDLLAPHGYIAGKEAWLFWIVLAMGAVVFLGVEGLILFIALRDRRRKGDLAEPKQVYGNRSLEILWTAIPIGLVLILFGLTLGVMAAVAPPSPSAGDLTVQVVGHQWWWEFDYPSLGIVTANELHIPVGESVRVQLVSADVIHSFWVPQLAGKTDVIPGQTNLMWLQSNQTGTFDGQCAEFCGLQHAHMRFQVVVQSAQDFQTWVAAQQASPPAPQTDLEQQGYQIVIKGVCSGCHTVNGTTARGTIGPNLTHVFSRQTIAGGSIPIGQMSEWIEDPQGMLPGNDMVIHLSNDEITAVLAYLDTLK